MDEDVKQAAISSLAMRRQVLAGGLTKKQVEKMLQSALGELPQPATSWRLHDLAPTSIASGSSAGIAWTTTSALSGVPSGATHALVLMMAITDASSDQISIDYRRDSSDATRPAVQTGRAQSSDDVTDVCNTIPVPLTAGLTFDYQVTGTFSAGCVWEIKLMGYYA